MKFSVPSTPASANSETSLETILALVEQELSNLGEALQRRNAAAIDRHAAELHRALTEAIHAFSKAAQLGPLSPALRSRLVKASGQVAAQRESLARATAALDRAIEVLIPPEKPAVYSPYGAAPRPLRGSVIQV
jgi:hypothetical protein